MISYLSGKPILDDKQLIILTTGVGYGVYVTQACLSSSSSKTQLELFIHSHIREDLFELYGFETKKEKELFMLLLSVSGVGPKTALTILQFSPNQISQAVREANVGLFTSVSRVGKKLAQKIIIELTTKLGTLRELELGELSPKKSELKEALLALGFEELKLYPLLEEVYDETLTTQEMIKRVLKKVK